MTHDSLQLLNNAHKGCSPRLSFLTFKYRLKLCVNICTHACHGMEFRYGNINSTKILIPGAINEF